MDGVSFALLDTAPDDLNRHATEGNTVLLQGSEAEQASAIKDLFTPGVEKVCVMACLGGHAGSCFAPVAAGLAKEAGKSLFCLVTMPFNFEGRGSKEKADAALAAMRSITSNIHVFNNEELLATYPDLNLFAAFQEADRKSGEVLAVWLQHTGRAIRTFLFM